MSGEADEDTMSAWSSLNGGGGSGSGGGLASPGEIGPALSVRRRSSFGMQMASFSEDPLQELQSNQLTLDAELAAVGLAAVARGNTESDGIGDTFGDVVSRAKDAERGGRADAEEAAGTAPTQTSIPIGRPAESSAAGTVPSGVEPLSPSEPASQGEGTSSAAGEIVTEIVANTTHGPTEGRRRSNQDDQSNDSDSARGADSSITGGSVRGEGASRGGGDEHPPPSNVQGSIASGGSEAR